mmetsp:Transcript_97404/g.160304  ORF Transcript_97404/g.160304 Transcript_97404/m.160304 type:complete len:166 (-) Transcript_97404:71-568(-)
MGAQQCCRAASDREEIETKRLPFDEQGSESCPGILTDGRLGDPAAARKCSPLESKSPRPGILKKPAEEPSSPTTPTSPNVPRAKARRPSITNGEGEEHPTRPEEVPQRRPSLTRAPTGHIKVVTRYLKEDDIKEHIEICEAEGVDISPTYLERGGVKTGGRRKGK